MNKELESLFTPWKIGNCEIKNRIVITSMGGTSIFGWMEPHHLDKEAANFLMEKAKNNVGLVLPGIAPIYNLMGGSWLYNAKHTFKELKKFMDEFHKTGAKLFIQLTAGMGRAFSVSEPMEKIMNNKVLNALAKPFFNLDRICASASPNPNRWSDKAPSRELTIKEINKMVEAFAKTAKMCKEAGVDGVEIHAVHEGYLLDQFTMKYTNQRTDEYGGSFENRYRFPVEIVKAIKEVCGEDYPVSLRYSVVSYTKGFREGALPGEEYTEVGRDMEESEKAAKYLQDAGYDMLNCDNGTYDSWYWSHPPMYMPQNCNLEDVEHIKKFVDIPVVVAGRMDPYVGAKAIAEGKIDGLGVARQFLADTEWVTKVLEDKEEDIRPCICCHNGCFTMSKYEGTANIQNPMDAIHMARCAINPETMQSKKYKIVPTKSPKHIAIIGGGIGGMEVARVCALRGHKATIYEKSDRLGGIFIAAASPSFKEKDRDLIEWYRREMVKLGIEVKLNTEVKSLADVEGEKVVVAIGAVPNRFKIKGIENTIEACEYLLGEKEVKENVIIVGGGLTGCEIAYDLFLQGKNPTIIEMKNDLIAIPGVCLANTSYLRDFFKLHKVPVYLETKVDEITEDGVVVVGKDGQKQAIKADNVIMSVGYHPQNNIEGMDNKTLLVGDCNKVGNLRTVIWRAWDIAMKL